MTKIVKMTPEQEARLPAYREEMRAKGLRLQWASEDQIRSAVVGLYSGAGLEKPAVFVLDSPLACLMGRMALKGLGQSQLGDQLWGQLGGQLWGQLWGQLRGQLRDQLWDQLRGQLRGQLWDQLRDQLWDQLRDQLRDQLGGQLRGQLWDQLRDQLWDQLGDQLGGQLGDQLWGQLREAKVEWQELWFAGGAEAFWIAFYDYAQSIGVKYSDGQSDWLSAWMKYAETCGCLYPYEGIAFVSRRPTRLVFNDNQLLHSEVGPAMEFADGFAIHAWNGVRVPKKWIESSSLVAPAEVLSTQNVEQRAAGISIIGMAKMLDKLDHKILDSDPDPSHGDLVQVMLPDLPDPVFYLKAECPRNGTIMEPVNPHEMDEMSVLAAQAWRVGIPTSEFIYPTVRT